MSKWPKVPYVGVGCVIIRDGRILLVRRQGAHGVGSWSTPGGHLDFAESPAQCAARETEEETGIRVSHVEFLAITNDVFTDAEKHYLTIWMRGQPDRSEAVARDATEIAEVGWFDLDAMPSPLFLSLANLVSGTCLPSVPSDWPF